jgi:carboxypeptidase C (cathepsin A)
MHRSINRAKEDGIEVTTMSLESGHMPMLKDPIAVARCIQEVVRGLEV